MAEEITQSLIKNKDSLTPVDEKYVDANFIVNHNAGEGNCLFHSVSQYVDVDPAVLRQMLCDFYAKYEKDEHRSLTEEQKFAFEHDVKNKNHSKEICKNGVWGGLTDLNFISILLDITVIFFNYNNSNKTYVVQVFKNGNDNERVVYIKYNGSNHFESMQLKSTTTPIEKIHAENVSENKEKFNDDYILSKNTNGIENNDDIPYRALRDMYSFESIWGSKNIEIFRKRKHYRIGIHLFPEDENGDIKDIFIYVTYGTHNDKISIAVGTKQIMDKDIKADNDQYTDSIVNIILDEIAAIEAAKSNANKSRKKKKNQSKAKTPVADAKELVDAVAGAKEPAKVAADAKPAADAKVAAKAKAVADAKVAAEGPATSTKKNGCEVYTFTANGKGGRKNRKTKRKRRKTKQKFNSKTRRLHSTSRKAS